MAVVKVVKVVIAKRAVKGVKRVKGAKSAQGAAKQAGPSHAVLRAEVYWVSLDPTVGSEIQKTRPALVVSPDDMNAALPRVIVAPLTSAGQPLGCRPEVIFQKKAARILLDQLRCVDKARLGKKLGKIDEALWHPVLLEMLA